jgi:hypothetical protein
MTSIEDRVKELEDKVAGMVRIEMTSPVRCPKCGTGHLLGFIEAQFKYQPPEEQGEMNQVLKNYEVVYRCSNSTVTFGKPTCGYEVHRL